MFEVEGGRFCQLLQILGDSVFANLREDVKMIYDDAKCVAASFLY